MIEYIKGSLSDLTPATVVVETSEGVGYMLNISLNTYSSLEKETSASQPVKLYVHESVREDAWTLYGFSTPQERSLFRLLIGVSGVGASIARVILSSYSVAELENIIASGNTSSLKQVKGVGSKTAERIIVDLKDKIKPADSTLLSMDNPASGRNSEVYSEALVALVTLGFPRAASQKVLDRLFAADPLLKVETAIKKALSML